MKKLLFIAAGIIISFNLSSQSCLPEGITFSTQTQIDSFQVNYQGCSEIDGDVTINGEDIINLFGLNALTSIKGKLLISSNANLTSLSGLENVISIGGQFSTKEIVLTIRENNSLTDMSGLNSLKALKGGLFLYYNTSLTSLAGIDSLISIGGDLWIQGNYDLATLSGLESLQSIGGDLVISGQNDLESLLPLSGLISLSGDLSILGTHLTNLTGLEGLTNIFGSVTINSNGQLTSLTGLDNITCIGESLQIGDFVGVPNYSLTSLSSLNNVTSIGKNLTISGNEVLPYLSGLDHVISIGGYITIIWNDSLKNLTGLEGLTSVGGYLNIYENNALTSLTGIDNIDSGTITGLYIHHNASLTSCNVQSVCEYLVSPNGSITIYNNAEGCNIAPEIADACGFKLQCLPFGNYYFLNQSQVDSFPSNYSGCTELMGNVYISGEDITNLTGLSIVTNIEKRLWIESNNSLTSLSGLDALTQVGYHLWIEGNNALMNLTGLENLTQIGGYLTIEENTSLLSLSGIDNLEAASISDVSIYENSSLSYCEVESICEFLSTPGLSIHFQQNAPGCNSLDEVFNACLTHADEINIHEDIFTVSPNPASTTITIEAPETSSQFQLSIFNLSGQEVIKQKAAGPVIVIDVQALFPGIYFVRLSGEKTVGTGKFVKLD